MGFMDHFYKAVDLEDVPDGGRGGKRRRDNEPQRETYERRDDRNYAPKYPISNESQYRQEPGDAYQAFQRESENTYIRQPLTRRPTTLSEVLVYAPKGYDDVQGLIDYLKNGAPIIVDLTEIRSNTAQRILDFLSGAIYAVDGAVLKLNGSMFLLTPAGVNISN